VAQRLKAVIDVQQRLLSERRAQLEAAAKARVAGQTIPPLPPLLDADDDTLHNTTAPDGNSELLSLSALRAKYDAARRSIDKQLARDAAAKAQAERASYHEGFFACNRNSVSLCAQPR
jgi:hypothetical protein